MASPGQPDADDARRDDVLKRMLGMAPKPHDVSKPLATAAKEEKPGGRPAKKDRPEAPQR